MGRMLMHTVVNQQPSRQRWAMFVTNQCLEPQRVSSPSDKALEHSSMRGSFCLLTDTHNWEPGSVPGWLPRVPDSVSLTWIWKTISVKSLGPFWDIHMLSNNQQTTYVILKCSIVLAPLPRKVPPSCEQRAATWSFQDPILLSNDLTLRHHET